MVIVHTPPGMGGERVGPLKLAFLTLFMNTVICHLSNLTISLDHQVTDYATFVLLITASHYSSYSLTLSLFV